MRLHDDIPRPAVEVVEFSDPTIANAGIELIKQDAVLLESMPLRVRRIIVRLADAAVVFHSANQRVRSNTSVSKGLSAYVVFGAHTRGTMNGFAVDPGVMIGAESGAEARFVTESGWQSITVMVRPQVFREHLSARHREDSHRVTCGVEALQVGVEKVGELFNWGKRLADTAARQPTLFDERPVVRTGAQAELFEMLISTLSKTQDFEHARGDRKRQDYSLMVKSVEDYALAHVGDHLLVTDLCKIAEVSERTLEMAFRKILGITPVAYLMRIRLHRVRQALLAESIGSTTVSAEALNWGFWHFGDFSRAYKECFGELPSDTLRRKPEELH